MNNDAVSDFNHHHRRRNHRKLPRRDQPLSVKLQPGHVAFRVVCHESILGGLIGRNGSVIADIFRDTGAARIHCSDSVGGSDHRVVFVVGPGAIDKTMVLHVDEAGRVECHVSCAQEALIRIFERVWALDKEEDEEAYCGLLADKSHIGAVMGRGGKNISRMRRETGAEITILPPPSCAAANDELIQIIGDTLAAKKALAAISCCLQDCPPIDKDPTPYNRPVEPSDPHAEFFPNLSALLLPVSGDVNPDPNRHSLSSNADGVSSPDTHREVLFRLLCSKLAAGAIIGKKGSIVRALQNETGASIMFAAPQTDSVERIVTISAMENLESRYSAAQNAVILVFARSIESDIQRGFSSGLSNGTNVTARLLVASDVVGCLTGDMGSVISEMIDSTGADIEILEEDQIEKYDVGNDVVVQITGVYKNVQNALFQVTARLRDSLLPADVLNEVRETTPYGRAIKGTSPGLHQSLATAPNSNQGTALTGGGMDQLTDSERSSTTFGGHLEIGRLLDSLLPRDVLNEVGPRSVNGPLTDITSSGLNNSTGLSAKSNQETILMRVKDKVEVFENMEQSKMEPAVGRNTYVEIPVAERALGAVYGEDHSNLARLRQISGAKVEVCDPCPGKSEGMVIISGKSDQVQAAQSLLLAFILSGK